jgi:hypothetical protein
MNIRAGWILCVAVLAMGAWISTAASGASRYGYQHLSTRCSLSQGPWGPVVAAQTSWRMWTEPHGGRDLSSYRWQARLIPTTRGLDFARPWDSVEVENVDSGAGAVYDGTVMTPLASSDLDWDLQVKLTWDRPNRNDWNVEHVLDFDESSCSTA